MPGLFPPKPEVAAERHKQSSGNREYPGKKMSPNRLITTVETLIAMIITAMARGGQWVSRRLWRCQIPVQGEAAS
jgi:hypothetical protein